MRAALYARVSTAGRSGLGAVMGSKKLNAVVARGTAAVPIADKAIPQNLRMVNCP